MERRKFSREFKLDAVKMIRGRRASVPLCFLPKLQSQSDSRNFITIVGPKMGLVLSTIKITQ